MTQNTHIETPEAVCARESPTTVSQLLTVIVTTSPAPSAPSTDLLTTIFESYQRHCPPLLQCRVIVVFDTYDYIGDRDRLKKGHVTAELAKNYETYKVKTKELVFRQYGLEHYAESDLIESQTVVEYGSPYIGRNSFPASITQTQDKRITFVEPKMRLGFALAVRSGLRLTETPYVWIQQHDWSLDLDIPIAPILEVMQAHGESATAPIRYVCLAGGRMLSHEETDHVLRFPELKRVMLEHRGDFSPPSQPETKIPLTPLFFWHDKPHIASTSHYLARIFPFRFAVPRGSFIEDTIGHRARAQMKEGLWTKWASWLYYPDQGKTQCLIHLKGRTWRGIEFTAELKATVEATRDDLARLKALARSARHESKLDEEKAQEQARLLAKIKDLISTTRG